MGKPNVVTKQYMKADVHYAMVVRNMLYDAMNYASQVEACAKENRKNKEVSNAEFLSGFAKTDTLHPVITLTIYWNYGAWDGARSLHEMLNVQDKAILDYVSDYKLNLIVPEEIKDFGKFKTELGPVLEFISDAGSGNRLKKALKEKEERWSVLGNEEVNLLNICLKAKLKITGNSEEGAGNKVCKGIIELQEMSRAEGKAEGLRLGRLNTLVQLVRDGLLSLAVAAERAQMSQEEFQKQM